MYTDKRQGEDRPFKGEGFLVSLNAFKKREDIRTPMILRKESYACQTQLEALTTLAVRNTVTTSSMTYAALYWERHKYGLRPRLTQGAMHTKLRI